eukprot:Opistho-1_new@22109
MTEATTPPGHPPAPEAAEQLIDAVQRLSTAQTVLDVQAIVKTAARRVTGADGACFVLRDEGKCYYADEDSIAPLWKGKRFPMEACISGWVMLNRQPALIPDIYLDPRIPPRRLPPDVRPQPGRRPDPVPRPGRGDRGVLG